MNKLIFSNVSRFILLVLFQVLILRRLSLEWSNFPYLNILIYPLFLLLLPLGMPRWSQFLLAFVLGLLVDLFYDSPGVHASASVFTIYFRPYVLNWLEPRGGYNVNHSPTKERMGFSWFLRYAGVLMLGHCLFYFAVDAFTPVLWQSILLKTALGYVFSMATILIITFIFNPQD